MTNFYQAPLLKESILSEQKIPRFPQRKLIFSFSKTLDCPPKATRARHGSRQSDYKQQSMATRQSVHAEDFRMSHNPVSSGGVWIEASRGGEREGIV